MSNIKQEIIWDNTTIKGTEKIETISQEVVQVPDYQYGLSQNTLDANIALRNNASTSKIAVWSFIITGTGIISITGLWFKPSVVRFDVCDQISSVWTWVMTANWQYAVNFALGTQITTQCIYYGNAVKARAIYVSMDSNWFTINCTYFAVNTYVNFTAQ